MSSNLKTYSSKGPKAIIFDVDGTLVDSNDLHVKAWREAFMHFGNVLSYEAVHREIGKGADQLMPVFCSPEELTKIGNDLEEFRTRLFKTKYLARVKTFPDVRKLFERVKRDNKMIALASSSNEVEVTTHIESLKISDLVDAFTSADDAERTKPNPDIFQSALVKLKRVGPAETIVVGDSPWDVIAARKIGLATIGLLSGGFEKSVLSSAGAVAVYRDITDLLGHYDNSPLNISIESWAAADADV